MKNIMSIISVCRPTSIRSAPSGQVFVKFYTGDIKIYQEHPYMVKIGQKYWTLYTYS